MSTVVVFHADAGAEVAASLVKVTPTFRSGISYRLQLDLLRRSLDRSMPDAELVLLTDAETELESMNPRIIVDRGASVTDGIMLARMRAQREYLDRAPDGPIFFLDADMLVLSALLSVLDDCDMAVTVRQDPEMPINGGFLAVGALARQRAGAFLDETLRIYVEEYDDRAAWFGDQLALASVVGAQRCLSNIGGVVEAAGARIRLLPCERYNRSPDHAVEYLRRSREIVIMHFKGARKRFMEPYWLSHWEARGRFADLPPLRVGAAWLRIARASIQGRRTSRYPKGS